MIVLQCDLLSRFSTRIVVPQLPAGEVEVTPRLHPVVQLGRRRLIAAMEQIFPVRLMGLDKVMGTARSSQYELQRAYDIVVSGI